MYAQAFFSAKNGNDRCAGSTVLMQGIAAERKILI